MQWLPCNRTDVESLLRPIHFFYRARLAGIKMPAVFFFLRRGCASAELVAVELVSVELVLSAEPLIMEMGRLLGELGVTAALGSFGVPFSPKRSSFESDSADDFAEVADGGEAERARPRDESGLIFGLLVELEATGLGGFEVPTFIRDCAFWMVGGQARKLLDDLLTV